LTFSVSYKKERLKAHIFVNGELWRTVSPRLFGKNPQFDVQSIEELEELEYRQALLFAVRSLSAKSQHSLELHKKILDLGASRKVVKRVIDELMHLGYLDDQMWCEDFVSAQVAKKMGKHAILQKIKMKGISIEECQEILHRHMTDELEEEQIKALMATKYRKKDMNDPKQRQQVVAGLMRRGFSWDLINICLKK